MPQPVSFIPSSAGARASGQAGAPAAVAADAPAPIVIGEAEAAAIRAAVAQARSLAERSAGGTHPQPVHVRLPMGYRAALGFERHATGLYRHLWIYRETPGHLPSMPSIRLIAEAFGFDLDGVIERHTWVEELAPGHHAVNILEMHISMPRSAA